MTQGAPSAKDIAESVVRLPRAFHTDNMSIFDLASRTGYFGRASEVGEDLIRECLAAVPALADDWLAFSDDRRTSGLYFRATARGYEVGYVGSAKGQRAATGYADKLDACAKFIKSELEEMRRRHPSAAP